jgi:hypothetical protein
MHQNDRVSRISVQCPIDARPVQRSDGHYTASERLVKLKSLTRIGGTDAVQSISISVAGKRNTAVCSVSRVFRPHDEELKRLEHGVRRVRRDVGSWLRELSGLTVKVW